MNMTNRTPSFIVIGLLIVIFLLGTYYMSCSSTTAELKRTLEDFEERIRTLSLKNSEHEREIESMNNMVQELELKKSDMQKELERKDIDLEDLNTKINEKTLEVQNLKLDKQFLDDQLVESKNIDDAVGSKNLIIEKLEQELQDQQKVADERLNALQKEIDTYKNQLNESQINQARFLVERQPFQSFLSINQTTNSSLFQGSFEAVSNSGDQNNLTSSIPSGNETNPTLTQTNLVNIANQEFQFNLTELNSTLNNSSTDQGLLKQELLYRFQRSMNDSLVENKILNDTNSNSSTTVDNAHVQTNLTTTTIAIQNKAEQHDDQIQMNDDNKDDIEVNPDGDQAAKNK